MVSQFFLLFISFRFLFVCLFLNKLSWCNSRKPASFYVDQRGLELRKICLPLPRKGWGKSPCHCHPVLFQCLMFKAITILAGKNFLSQFRVYHFHGFLVFRIGDESDVILMPLVLYISWHFSVFSIVSLLCTFAIVRCLAMTHYMYLFVVLHVSRATNLFLHV